MRVGLIDVDGHNFPNLALMRISAWHKSQGDHVEWWFGDIVHYDVVYMSKIFSDAYTPDVDEPINADRVIKGGTGYCISLKNDIEVFDKTKNAVLPLEMERMFPDYSIYPQYDYAVAMTSRGCPNSCGFCHVSAKEGCCSRKVANVSDFWNGQKTIVSLDANLTACCEKRELFAQYADTGAWINFSQGLDIRRIDDADIADLNRMKLKEVHFAWDNPKADLTEKFERYATMAKHKPHGAYGSVYVLTNYNSTFEEDLERVYALRAMGFDPDIRIYNKPNAPKKTRLLQRWVNNKIIFRSCERFEDYDPKLG